ncbi:MAG TPA: CBS domain-containing protein [Gemmatimonadaceae bacterium]|nr:CBS domain-containing protein [Gemmatimonadaceae bacterium]
MDSSGEAGDRLDPRLVGDIMQTRVVTIGPEEAAGAAWTRMRRRGIRHLVVLDHDDVVGVLSERDLGGRAGADLRSGRRVRDLMTRQVLQADPTTTLRNAADVMRSRLIGSLPVVQDDRIVGIVTATDVFDALGSDKIGRLSGAEKRLLRAPSSSRSLGGRTISRSRDADGDEATRRRRPDQSTKREPFAAVVSRPAKRLAGRTRAPDVPANIRISGVTLTDHERDYIRKKLGTKLGKFATFIERVTFRATDVNGPRGGIDQHCSIKVVLSGLPSVVFESQASSLRVAINTALAGVERAVRRAVARRQATRTGR